MAARTSPSTKAWILSRLCMAEACACSRQAGSNGMFIAPGGAAKDLNKLWTVVDRLLTGEPLEPRHRTHRLSGQWARSWECHIEPDWLLIWHVQDDALVLTRTGTHADLFG